MQTKVRVEKGRRPSEAQLCPVLFALSPAPHGQTHARLCSIEWAIPMR
jgi:hypothetical protein